MAGVNLQNDLNFCLDSGQQNDIKLSEWSAGARCRAERTGQAPGGPSAREVKGIGAQGGAAAGSILCLEAAGKQGVLKDLL